MDRRRPMLTSEFISVAKLKLHDSDGIMINKCLCFIHAGFPVHACLFTRWLFAGRSVGGSSSLLLFGS